MITALRRAARIGINGTSCKFPQQQRDPRQVDLLYNATEYYDVKKAIQDCKREDLTYDKLIEMAKKVERAKVDEASYKENLQHTQPPFTCHAVSNRQFQSPGRR